jgi:hypothetical protein
MEQAHVKYTINIKVVRAVEPHKAKNSKGYDDINVPASIDVVAEISATDSDLLFLSSRALDALNYLLPSTPPAVV